jgi:hypothetical protein
MVDDSGTVVLISHPNLAFEGARNLFTARDAVLIAVTRTSLHCACRRLREEGAPPETMVLIRDANDMAPDAAGRIRDVLA